MADPLRIAVISPNRPAYSETFIRDQLRLLPGRVTAVFGPRPYWEWQERAILPRWRRSLESASDRFPAIQTLASRSTDAALARFLQGRRVDVVLAQYGPTAVSVLEACERAGIPLVAHFHGYDAHQRSVYENHRAGYAQLFERAAGLIVVSTFMLDHLGRIGAPLERMALCPCGANTGLFLPGTPEQNPLHAVAVGRFVEKKAPHMTLLAFSIAAKHFPDARLTMAGEGPLLPTCRQLAVGLGIADRVSFPGRQTPEEVAALLRTARLFAQHSVEVADTGDSEGTPVAVLEAGAAGLPVVATAHAGIKDAVLEGSTGFLVPELDSAAMAERMCVLFAEPATAGEMGREARRHIAEHHSLERSVARLYAVLEAAGRGMAG